MHEEIFACRVVRGPDWKWGNQDNGEGHVGTVVEIGRSGSASSPDKTVVVQWDMGSRTNYRIGYQEAYDLRLFDNAPAGVRHPNVVCDGCKDHGISGMLWKCANSSCFDYDLCTTCYMNDTHSLSHPFKRYDTPSSAGVDVPPRLDSPKIMSRGIFAGARVVRGPDWDWGLQDGGEGKVGRVVDIRGWDNESGRSVSNVIWSSGSTNVYRLGHKGKVDLKCVQANSGGPYYVNHLPILGMPSTHISRGTVPPVKTTLTRNQHSFSVGDKVQVVHDIARLKDLQDGHGGWNPRMAEFVGKVGTVHRVTDKGDIRVQYDSGIRWTFNPIAVLKITSFSVGDAIQVLNDYAKVKELQAGHGEWVDIMKDILGASGTVIKVYTDNDLRINFGNSAWTMNPLAVKSIPPDRFETNNSMYAKAHRREETMSQDPMTAMLPQLLTDLTLDNSSYTVERFVREAAQGRVESVKKMLPKIKEKINHKSSGKSALQVSAHQGHVEIVVLLIAHGAQLEIADDEGDTALHYSAFGNQPLVMELLLKAGALVNAVNRTQCSPLHVSVNKQYIECVKTLLKYKCNVNIQDSYGDTGLHDAIGKDNREIIDCFVNTPGVDFTLRNNRGFNVLHHAALKGNHFAVERLLGKARQLVDVKKDDGFAAIHLATLNGHYDVTKALIGEGQAELDIRNNRKQTPLILAVSQGYCGIVEHLVDRGANVAAEDEDGDTPLHIILLRHIEGKNEQSQTPHPGQMLNPVTSLELRKHDHAPSIALIWSHLITCGWNPSDEDMGGSALACFIAQAGADLNKRNRRGATPIDLVRPERLKEMLAYYSAQGVVRITPALIEEANRYEGEAAGVSLGRPLSMTSPSQLGSNSTIQAAACAITHSPPLPEMHLSSQPRGECIMCTEVVDFVRFEPCGHLIVCEECSIRMKKCLTCQQPISKKLTRNGRLVASNIKSSNNPNSERLKYLENKFAEIEESYCCSICMERRRNVAFLCGHGSCEKCADALSNCHMCRTPIKQKINLY